MVRLKSILDHNVNDPLITSGGAALVSRLLCSAPELEVRCNLGGMDASIARQRWLVCQLRLAGIDRGSLAGSGTVSPSS